MEPIVIHIIRIIHIPILIIMDMELDGGIEDLIQDGEEEIIGVTAVPLVPVETVNRLR